VPAAGKLSFLFISSIGVLACNDYLLPSTALHGILYDDGLGISLVSFGAIFVRYLAVPKENMPAEFLTVLNLGSYCEGHAVDFLAISNDLFLNLVSPPNFHEPPFFMSFCLLLPL